MASNPRDGYIFQGEIGRGTFGVVFKVQRKSDNKSFVCKQVPLHVKYMAPLLHHGTIAPRAPKLFLGGTCPEVDLSFQGVLRA